MPLKDHRAEYEARCVSPEEAASLIPTGANVSMGMALGEPPELLRAINARIEAGQLTDIRLWYFHSMQTAAETILRYEMMDHVHPHCMFMGGTERTLQKRGEQDGKRVLNFVPVAFSDAPRLLSENVELDTFITTVAPMDKHGFLSLGTNNDYASVAARSAKKLIVEVNPNMPRVFGESQIHISEIDALIENDEPLFEMTVREAKPAERQIGEIISQYVPDGACLQMGIGALPNEVCGHLKDRKNLGIHTELLSPGLVDLIECGAVNNTLKSTFRKKTVFTFAMGNQRMYRLLDDNPAMASHPVNIVNDPRHIAKNDNVVSINATLEVDLTGACNSENISHRQYSGSGGQLDFVRGARASKNGRSFIACTSTAKGGTISRVVPELSGPVTTPRNDVDTIVTEFGAVRLIGLTGIERAKAMISIAHPDHRKDLEKAARKLCLI